MTTATATRTAEARPRETREPYVNGEASTNNTIPEDAKHLMDLGFTIFPCNSDKKPKVKWQNDPPPNGWHWSPLDLIGVRLPEGTVVVDIDNDELFKEQGLDLPDTQQTTTHRPGNSHTFYRTDGRTVKQTTKQALGYDTRVGGKGYVIAWNSRSWAPVGSWGLAPDWLYKQAETTVSEAASDEPIGTREGLRRMLGGLRRQNPTINHNDLVALMLTRQRDGRIVDLDPTKPWTVKDFANLATMAMSWTEDQTFVASFNSYLLSMAGTPRRLAASVFVSKLPGPKVDLFSYISSREGM